MNRTRQLSPPEKPHQYNFSNPLFDDHEGAAFIGCAPFTLRRSRTTGTLFGVKAPAYIKMGRIVRYKRVTLEEWVSQFPERQNTAQEVEK